MANLGIQSYQNSLVTSLYQKNQVEKKEKTDKKETEQTTSKKEPQIAVTANKKEVTLSSKAEEYLTSLKEKYNNMDFVIADYTTNEEAQQLMAQAEGEKKYTVLIDPDTLEAMAADSETAAKYESILDNATKDFDTVKEELEKDGEEVQSIGMSIDNSGNIQYFVELDKQRQKIDEINEKKAEEKAKDKKAEEKKAEEKKETIKVTANSIEELIENVRQMRKDQEAGLLNKNAVPNQYTPFEAVF